MNDPQALGALASIHELQLVETLPPRDCNRRFEPGLPSAGWLLGRAVYLELHLLRNRVRGDDDLASRVRHLFDNARPPTQRWMPSSRRRIICSAGRMRSSTNTLSGWPIRACCRTTRCSQIAG